MSRKWFVSRVGSGEILSRMVEVSGVGTLYSDRLGKRKVRYKTMRGYKSISGVNDGIALTQWLYDGEDEHDLAKEMAV